MKRPLFWAACWHALGILGAAWTPLPWPWIMAWTWGVALLFLVWTSLRVFLLGPLLLLSGWTQAAIWKGPLHSNDVRHWAGRDAVWIKVRGYWEGDSRQHEFLDGTNRVVRVRGVLRVAARSGDGNGWRAAAGRLQITGSEPWLVEFERGGLVEATGWLSRPQGAWAPGLYDERRHLALRGIHYELSASEMRRFAPGTNRGGRAEGGGFAFQPWARAVLARGLPVEDDALRLLWAMCLGWRTGLQGEVAEPFMQTGTMHVFAISGMHVALVNYCLVALLRMLRLPRWVCGVVGIPLLWYYAGATDWQPSAVRATVMASVVMVGWSLHRPGDLLNSLGGAALILLVWDPGQLFHLGFQLSFLVVMSLAVGAWKLKDELMSRIAKKAEVPRLLLRTSGRWRWRAQVHLASAVAVSLTAWLASTPWVALYFHYFNPIAVAANLVLVPLTGLAMGSAILSLITSAWCPAISVWFNHGGWFWMSAMMWVSQQAAAIPGGWFHVAAPSILQVSLYYALLTTLFLGAWKRRAGRAAWCAGCLVLAGLIGAQFWEIRSRTRLTILPGPVVWYAGRGGGTSILVDTGNERSVRQRLLPWLRVQGVNRLRHLVLTHGDQRHVGGAAEVIADYEPDTLWVAPVSFRSKAYRALVQAWESRPSFRRTAPGMVLGDWRVLHPGSNEAYAKADDGAVVLWGTFFGVRVLLMSDLGADGQNALLNRYPDLRADLVVTGLASEFRAVSDLFLDVVQPRLLVVADEDYPVYERADRRLRERLRNRDCEVLYTHEAHLVSVELGPGTWRTRRGGTSTFVEHTPR